jgi:putative serine protease PepD
MIVIHLDQRRCASPPLEAGPMPPSLLTDPEPRPLTPEPEFRSPPPARPGRHTGPPPPPRRGRLAALLATSALLGGGASVGVLAATGVIPAAAPQTTTVVHTTASTTAQGTVGGLDPQALYAGTSAGVVDITVAGTSPSQSASPFGVPPQGSRTTATGTGFLIDHQGNIVTAAHVVDGASSITVKLQDGTTRKATLLGKDDATDVAVLKIDASGLTLHPLKLGSSASVGVGAQVAVIGDPFGYERSISTGIVSGVDRTISAPNGFTVAHAIQTDAAMNPGNSGGPVLNAAGEVVGVVDQIATNGNADQSSGVGFAVPIDIVKSALPTLQAGGKVSHAYLGIATSDGGTGTAGATIGAVTAGGPAQAAGLRAGDVVTSLAGTRVTGPNDLVAAIAGHAPGDKVAITVTRGSQTVALTVTLGTQPARSSG